MAEIETTKIPAIQKAALILIAMGIKNAAQVLKHLNESEIENITIEVARQRNIPAETIGTVIEEYYQLMLANQYIVQGGLDFAKQILEEAWGEKRAGDILQRAEATTEVSAFYLLQSVDDKQLLNFLQNEHPQTTALILANLKPPQAASVLSELPGEIQSEIAFRLATIEKTSPELIADIETVLRQQMGSVFGGNLSATGGSEVVAEILNSATKSAEKNILDNIRERDPELADEITSLMFTFEDINGLTDDAIQRIVKEIDSGTLALAMKAIGEELKEKILKNMSERAAEMLNDELQYLGPVRLKEVESAQKQILDIVHQLGESGEIIINRGEEEEIIE